MLDALLLGGFAVGYAVRYLPPRPFWWTDPAGVALPYLALLLLGTTLAVAWARRWKLLAVHLIFLTLAVVRFVPLNLLTPQPAPSPDDLTVLTFNVPRWPGPADEVKKRGLEKLVNAEQPDLLAFQEAFLRYHANPPHVRGRPYMTFLVDSAGYAVVGPLQGKRTNTYQPVLGKVQLEEQTRMTWRRNSADKRVTRVVRTRFRWQGRTAVHYNLHLRTFGDRKLWKESNGNLLEPSTWYSYLRQYRKAYLDRAWEARKIRKMLDRERLPFIVSGDFNSTPHSWVYRKLARGLTDAFLVAGREWGATYHADFPFARIDFVLASPEWEIVEAHVPAPPLSDHRPVVARLRWETSARNRSAEE